jgi:hypothetical protein
MIAFWWEDWPGTMLGPSWSGWADTVLVVAAGAVFVAMLELTLVSEGWPLRRFERRRAGLAALAAAWASGIVVYLTLADFHPLPGSGFHARHGPLPTGELGAILVCIGACQVGFFVVMRGWPFSDIASRAIRLLSANVVVVAGGSLAYLALAHAADLKPATISAVAGSVVASGLIVGMLFEGCLSSRLPARRARPASVGAVAVVAALLYLAIGAYANAVDWTRAAPEEWIAYAGLNAIGAGVILHVAVGRRWPFAS